MRKEKDYRIEKLLEALLIKFNLNNYVNKLFWPTIDAGKAGEIILENKIDCFGDFKNNISNPVIASKFKKECLKWQYQSELLVKVKNIIVEPTYGLILNEDKNLVNQSRIHSYIFPSPFLKFGKLKYKTEKIQKAIYFDGYVGTSYYHFYADVLNKIPLYKKLGNTDYQYLIGEKVFNSKIFQFLLKSNDFFKNINWKIIRNDTIFYVDELIIAKGVFNKTSWAEIRQLFPESESKSTKRKIFLHRAKEVGRTIRNSDEVINCVKSAGYEVVDTEFLSLEDQIQLFSEAEVVVGVHGAGLTNILFSDSTAKLIEIFPSSPLRPHYFWLSNVLGLKYDAVMGSEMDKDQLFELNVADLKKLL